MREHLDVVFAIGLGLTLAMALAPAAAAEPNPVTAIDIALEPDATMIQHAMAANARLLKAFPKGFALDATHHPHISMLQQFVRTDDLDVWTESRRTGSMRQPLHRTRLDCDQPRRS